ncbi:hypothetical protein AAOGI_06750 [Agarivorans albus]
MNFFKKKRFWVSIGAVAAAVSTGQVTPETVAAGVDIIGALLIGG